MINTVNTSVVLNNLLIGNTNGQLCEHLKTEFSRFPENINILHLRNLDIGIAAYCMTNYFIIEHDLLDKFNFNLYIKILEHKDFPFKTYDKKESFKYANELYYRYYSNELFLLENDDFNKLNNVASFATSTQMHFYDNSYYKSRNFRKATARSLISICKEHKIEHLFMNSLNVFQNHV